MYIFFNILFNYKSFYHILHYIFQVDESLNEENDDVVEVQQPKSDQKPSTFASRGSLAEKAFDKITSSGDSQKIKCKFCDKTYELTGKDGSTSGPLKHLRNKHPDEHEKIKNQPAKELQEKKRNFFKGHGRQIYRWNDPKRVRLNRRLVYMICKDLLPLYMVEKTGFRFFLAGVDKCYVLPSRKTLRENLIPEVYEEVKTALKKKFATLKKVAITTDMWSSPTNISFNTVTCHYYDLEMKKLDTKILKCSVFPGRHTSENIAQDIEECMKDYGIENKTSGATSDNEAAVKKALRNLPIPDPMNCYAHTLNLVHDDGLSSSPKISQVIEKFSSIVTLTKVIHFKKHSDQSVFSNYSIFSAK